MIEVIIPLWTLVQLMFAIIFGIVIGGGMLGVVLWILTRTTEGGHDNDSTPGVHVTRPRSPRW